MRSGGIARLFWRPPGPDLPSTELCARSTRPPVLASSVGAAAACTARFEPPGLDTAFVVSRPRICRNPFAYSSPAHACDEIRVLESAGTSGSSPLARPSEVQSCGIAPP